MTMDSDFSPEQRITPHSFGGKMRSGNRRWTIKARQEAFIEHYAIYGDVRKAAIHAGCRHTDALWHGNSMLASPAIKKRIIEEREHRLERAGARKDAILEHYAKIAFFDIGELFDDLGNPLPVIDMPESARRIVQKVIVTQRYDKDGCHVETKTQVEIPSRLAALDQMAGAIGCKASIKVDLDAKIEVNPFAAIVERAQGHALRPTTRALPDPKNAASDAHGSVIDGDFSEIDDE
jgi:hypothetical protein